MDITLLSFEDCPNWKTAAERLTRLAMERPNITVTHQLVETSEQADHVGFLGSPSIRVDGVDVMAEPGARVGLACRRYLVPGGYQGAPTLEQLRGGASGRVIGAPPSRRSPLSLAPSGCFVAFRCWRP